jgi:lipopolysaccharide transport system permease protein
VPLTFPATKTLDPETTAALSVEPATPLPELPGMPSLHVDGRVRGDSVPPSVPKAGTAFTRLAPSTAWPSFNFAELWKFRELLFFLVWRDVKVRYKQTLLGAAWSILQPAMMMVVFTVFFNRLAKLSTGGLDPDLFYLSGLLPWYFFQQSVNSAGGSIIGSEHLITKIYFPRLIIPAAAVLAAVFDSLIACTLLGVMMAAYGVAPGVNLFVLPLIYVIIALLGLGLGSFIAALNVTYRDVRYIVPYVLQLGLFATPTIYMTVHKETGRTVNLLMEYNPMTQLVSAYRAATVGGAMPWAELGVASLLGAIVAVLGCLYFRKTEDRFADII